jgi:hypothetical protein
MSVSQCCAAWPLQAERTLMAEQRKTDFRPPEDGEPPPLDRPTDACVLVAALLSALLRLAAQHLQASNLASFDTEVRGTAHAPVRRPCTSLGCRGGPSMHYRRALCL